MDERRRAVVFLDRDGVINRKPREEEYVTSWDEVVFLDGAVDAIRRLNDYSIPVVIVTNQRGIALGLLTSEMLEAIHARLLETLAAHGASVAGVYVCPHDEGVCDCRKPQVGLFHRAAAELGGIDFMLSFVVGDSAPDVEAGRRLGARTILIAGDGPPADADFTAPSLIRAVEQHILPALGVPMAGGR